MRLLANLFKALTPPLNITCNKQLTFYGHIGRPNQPTTWKHFKPKFKQFIQDLFSNKS